MLKKVAILAGLIASLPSAIKDAVRLESAHHNLNVQPMGHGGARNGRYSRRPIHSRVTHWIERDALLNQGTCFEKAGVLRVKKKLSGHLPVGHDFGGKRRGTKAIGVNGIRGASGGGR